MRRNTKHFRKILLTAVIAAFAILPMRSFAQSSFVTIKPYVYSLNCNLGSNLDINKIIESIKNCFENLQCIVPPQTDSENNTPIVPETPGEDNDSTTNNVSEFELKVVELVNQHRIANGLEPLTLNVELSNVARTKSQDMKDNGYFSHTSPTYGSPFDMLKQFGISYRTAGENIARGQRTPQAVVDGWMNSDGHRANILNPAFTQIGVGYVAEGNYWTQLFIG